MNMSRIYEIVMELEKRNNESLKKLNNYYDKFLKVAKYSSVVFIEKWVKSL